MVKVNDQENINWTEYYKQRRDAALHKACKETGIPMSSVVRIFELCEEYHSEIEGI